jgi:tetratricopeptide (TPR) repeat protein
MLRAVLLSAAIVLAGLTTLGPVPGLAMGGSDSPGSTASYRDGEKAVKAKDYKKAVEILELVVKAEPRNADAYNYLGYSHRKLGALDKAFGYYETALKINPKHRGAHEYLGELHLQKNELAKAEGLLAKLRELCPRGCEEFEDLKKAIDDFKAGRKSS